MKKFLMLALVAGSFSLLETDYASAASDGAATKPAVQSAPKFGVRRSTRSYSYAPSAAPMMRRSSPARVPSYLLPKSDPRKYNGF